MVVGDLFDERGDGADVAGVEGVVLSVVAHLFSCGFELGLGAADDDDFLPLRDKPFRDGATETAATACYYCALEFEVLGWHGGGEEKAKKGPGNCKIRGEIGGIRKMNTQSNTWGYIPS